MLTIAYYFLQVVLCSGLMMGYYLLVLRNKRFHQYNRFYLLAVAVLSWLIPLIKIRWGHPEVSEGQQMIRLLSVVADGNSQIEETIIRQGFQWSWSMLATAIYLLVAAVLLTGMVAALVKVYRLLKHHSCKNVEEVYLILTNAKGTPFSFFRYIFWNEAIDMRSESGRQMLKHELTHVRQMHSVDKILIQLMLVVGWFNPFFWLIKKEMEMIHEFIADKKAVNNGDTGSLAQMLLTAAYPQQRFALTHPFFFSPIRRRLAMLTNNKHPRFSYIRRAIVLPLLGVVVILFSFRNKIKSDDKGLSVASVMENVADAVSKRIEGPALLVRDSSKGLFSNAIVKDPGMITATLDSFKAESHIKAINSQALPMDAGGFAYTDTIVPVTQPSFMNWAPVISTIPPDVLLIVDGIRRENSYLKTIDQNDIQEINILKDKAMISLFGSDGARGIVKITTKSYYESKKNKLSQLLIIIDGVKYDNALGLIDPSMISRIDVMNDKTAIEKYGEEGKNGVIEIETKAAAAERMKEYNKPKIVIGYPLPTGGKLPDTIERKKTANENGLSDLQRIKNSSQLTPGKYDALFKKVKVEMVRRKDAKNAIDPAEVINENNK